MGAWICSCPYSRSDEVILRRDAPVRLPIPGPCFSHKLGPGREGRDGFTPGFGGPGGCPRLGWRAGIRVAELKIQDGCLWTRRKKEGIEMTDKERFKRDLLELGVKPGDMVLVHSSMKALGTECAPEEIIDAMEEVLGEEGTLLMPALTYENVTAEQPVFDSAATEPCIGLLPRTFLHRPGVERSVHPTHSVCAKGKMAHRLTVGHSMDDTAVGPHSPFMLLPLFGGKLLFIGDIMQSCTFMHGIETILKPPYIRQTPSPVFTVDGQARQYVANDGYGWGSEFQRIEEILEEPDIRRGKLLAANAYLIDARALFAAALLKMWAEPYAFITDISAYI